MLNYPKLRYKGFEDSWNKHRVGDVFNITRGNVLSKENMDDNGDYPVYSSQTINNGIVGYTDEFLYENAITWTTDGANAGDVNYRNGKFYCTNVCGVLLSKEGYANITVANIINKCTKNYVSYVGNPKLMNNVMSIIKIKIPGIEEQNKISSLIEKIDILINEKENEINNINSIRKYQLQKYFSSNINQSKMQDIMTLKNGRDYKHCLPGDIPVYGTGGLMTKISQYLSDKDGIGIGRKGTIDNPFILIAPFWTVDTLFYAIPKKVPLYYLFLQFQSINWKLYNEGSTLPSLTSKSINNIKINIHNEIEIMRISNLFENIDKLIVVYKNELEYYRNIKHILLLKMLL